MEILAGVLIALIIGISGWMIFRRREKSEKLSEPMSKTMSGKTHSKFEQDVLDRRYFSKINKPKKSKKEAKL